MNKFSMRVLPVAVALSATLAFAAQAQMGAGVRDGSNSHIDSDARAHAMATVNGSTPAQTQTPVAAQNAGGAKGTMGRTVDKVEGAMGKAADATKRTAKRVGSAVGSSVGGVAERADRGIQNALPGKAAGSPSVNLQGSGNTAGQVARPPQ